MTSFRFLGSSCWCFVAIQFSVNDETYYVLTIPIQYTMSHFGFFRGLVFNTRQDMLVSQWFRFQYITKHGSLSAVQFSIDDEIFWFLNDLFPSDDKTCQFHSGSGFIIRRNALFSFQYTTRHAGLIAVQFSEHDGTCLFLNCSDFSTRQLICSVFSAWQNVPVSQMLRFQYTTRHTGFTAVPISEHGETCQFRNCKYCQYKISKANTRVA